MSAYLTRLSCNAERENCLENMAIENEEPTSRGGVKNFSMYFSLFVTVVVPVFISAYYSGSFFCSNVFHLTSAPQICVFISRSSICTGI